MLLLLLPAVHSLGISPGRRTVDFEPGQSHEIPFTVSNNEQKDMRLVISARGELAQYITLSHALVDFTEEDTSKAFSYRISLPDKLDRPGVHSAEIVVMEVPSEKGGDGTFVGATVSVVTELRVRVPYKGKYAEIRLDVSEAKVGETTTFIVPVMNVGEEDILKAKGSIDVLGPTNERIMTVDTDEKSIKSKETKELIAQWRADVNPGKYYGVATVTYDGLQTRAERVFSVGDLSIVLIEVNVKDFRLGGIAKFEMLIENRWNEPLEDVFVTMTIFSEKGDLITEVKSSSERMDALGKKTFFVYWDTESVPQGSYNTKVVINYGDKTLEIQSKIVVTLDSIQTRFVEVTGQVIGEEEAKGGINTLLILGIAVLIIINMGWFVFMRKNRKQ